DAHALVFDAACRRRRLIGRIHRLRIGHQHLKTQRRNVANGFHAVDETLRYLHEKALRRDERLDAFDGEADLTVLNNPERAVVLLELTRSLRARRPADVPSFEGVGVW